jgi:hypothetical protein
VFSLYTLSVIFLLLILVVIAGRGRLSMARIAYLSIAWFALVFVAYIFLPGPLPTGSYLQRFDPTIWQQPDSAENEKGDITSRQKMLADLLENVLPGRSQAEIEKLLGPGDDAADRKLIYGLGRERDSMFPIDNESLVIRLDGSGRFSSYYIYID